MAEEKDVGGVEKAKLELELELEKAKLELAKVIAERRRVGVPKPWWQSWSLAGATTAIAAMVPITTGVQTWVQKDKEIRLEGIKQSEAIKAAYLDRAKDPAERRRTLRLLIATAPEPGLKIWAQRELEETNVEIEKVTAEINKSEASVAAIETQLQTIADEKKRVEILLVQLEEAHKRRKHLYERLPKGAKPRDTPDGHNGDIEHIDPWEGL